MNLNRGLIPKICHVQIPTPIQPKEERFSDIWKTSHPKKSTCDTFLTQRTFESQSGTWSKCCHTLESWAGSFTLLESFVMEEWEGRGSRDTSSPRALKLCICLRLGELLWQQAERDSGRMSHVEEGLSGTLGSSRRFLLLGQGGWVCTLQRDKRATAYHWCSWWISLSVLIHGALVTAVLCTDSEVILFCSVSYTGKADLSNGSTQEQNYSVLSAQYTVLSMRLSDSLAVHIPKHTLYNLFSFFYLTYSQKYIWF